MGVGLTYSPSLVQPPRIYVQAERTGSLSWWSGFYHTTFGRRATLSPNRVAVASVSGITLGINDENNTAEVSFPQERFSEGGTVIGTPIKIKAYWAHLPVGSIQLFRGIILEPSNELGSSADGNSFRAVGYKFVLSSKQAHGSWMATEYDEDRNVTSYAKNPFQRLVFNENGKPDKSPNKVSVSAESGTGLLNPYSRKVHVFSKDSDKAQFWTLDDVLEYMLFLEIGQRLPGVIRLPEETEIQLNSSHNAFDYELEGSNFTNAITRIVKDADPLNSWYLDDMNSYVFHKKKESDLIVFSTRPENTRNNPSAVTGTSGTPSPSELYQTAVLNAQEKTRRVVIGVSGNGVTDHPEYNVGSLSVSQNAADVVNRLHGVGGNIEVETTIELEPAWSDEDFTNFKTEFANLRSAGKTTAQAMAQLSKSLKTTDANDSSGKNIGKVFRCWRIPEDYDYERIEEHLDGIFGTPEAFDIETSWFFPGKQATALPKLITEVWDDKKKKSVHPKLKVIVNEIRQDPSKATTSLIEVYEEVSGTESGYKFDPKTGTLEFSTFNVVREAINFTSYDGTNYNNITASNPDTWITKRIFLTAVLKTNARLYYDSERQGTVPITIERTEDREGDFKAQLKFESMLPDPDGKYRPKIPTVETDPLEWEETTGKTGLNLKTEIKFNNYEELAAFIDSEVAGLKDAAFSATWMNPRFDATLRPGDKVNEFENSEFTGLELTVVGLALDLQGFKTSGTLRNK